MIKNYFQNYFNRVKATKQVSKDSGINWLIPLLNSILITVVVSFYLAQGVWFMLDSWQSGQVYEPWYMQYLWQISSFSASIFMTIIMFSIQDKIILGFIKLNSYTNKLILNAISKADMLLWRKYGKENMITNAIWKIQMKYMNRSKKEKKIISYAFMACLGLYYCVTFIYWK